MVWVYGVYLSCGKGFLEVLGVSNVKNEVHAVNAVVGGEEKHANEQKSVFHPYSAINCFKATKKGKPRKEKGEFCAYNDEGVA